MTITAKFPGCCAACHQSFAAGSKIEWSKGSPARHAACAAGTPGSADARIGYTRHGRATRRQCKTGGNCSSFGSGRSCGAEDCDGY